MTPILFHLALTLGILWYQRATAYRLKPLVLSLTWFAVSSVLVFIEGFVVTGRPLSWFLPQGLTVGLFHLPAIFFAARWADKRRGGFWGPMALFLLFAVFATIAAAIVLARAELVRGLDI